MGLKNLKILFCLNLLDKKKISNKEISIYKVIEKISIPKFPFDGKFLLKKVFKREKKLVIY